MKYVFRALDFWEELKAAIGDIPVSVTDSPEGLTFDFGAAELSPVQEAALVKLMAEKPLHRGKPTKFKEKKP